MALVARAKRELLLRVYRHQLRREDLEDCFSQATLELVAHAQRGGTFASRLHLENLLELRYVSRIRDLRRALSGRSPMQAALEAAVSLGGVDEEELTLADPRAELDKLVILREDLRRVQLLARKLSPDHAGWYVAEVEAWAGKYRAPSNASVAGSEMGGEAGLETGADLRLQDQSPTAVRFVDGERAVLAPGDGHVALVPAAVPARVQAMVVAGNELQSLPYGPGGHPDPRGSAEEDCSSTVNYVLYRSGVRPIGEILGENPLAQDYVRWGEPGPGRWVSVYAATVPTPHVFMLVAGLRLDTSHNGTDVGPNRDQDGPRWRILDQVPTWARWSVRHPPGL